MPPTTESDTATAPALPPVAPDVLAAAVEALTSRLRKKLDAAIEAYAALPVAADGGVLRVVCGEDAEVTLAPGPSGAVTDADQAVCSCLLAPRCLHRTAVLGACPIADGTAEPEPSPEPGPEPEPGPGAGSGDAAGDGAGGAPAASWPSSPSPSSASPSSPSPESTGDTTGTTPAPLTPAQVTAAAGLWSAAAAVLQAGVPAAGAVLQAEVLRAAHTARLAGLLRAEAAALRVVRGLRAARSRHDGHRLADLVAALRELLLTTGRLAGSHAAPGLVGTARRAYKPGGGLRVHGMFREPVITATGYGGVVTHLLGPDGRWFTVADVRPGGPSRAKGAATATVALGAAVLDHARLARGGLLINGATVSPEGRLGAGRGVKATPLAGVPWGHGPSAELFARPLAEAVAARLAAAADAPGDGGPGDPAGDPVGCDLEIVGPAGDHVLARELPPGGASSDTPTGPTAPTGPLIRLVPANGHPELAHTENLRRLASRPGLRIRVIGRLDPDRAATLRPLAAGPVPGTDATLRLPDAWQGRADLGYDRLQGAHLPPPEACGAPAAAAPGPDPLADSPLWQVRRLVELAVAGGRRAVAESGRGRAGAGAAASLRAAGLRTAAGLCGHLTAEADRRGRDAFGRLTDPDPDGYAWAWVAAAVHLMATERALVQASWQGAAV